MKEVEYLLMMITGGSADCLPGKGKRLGKRVRGSLGLTYSRESPRLEANIRVTGQLEHKTGLVSSGRFLCSVFCIAGCHPAAAGWTQI